MLLSIFEFPSTLGQHGLLSPKGSSLVERLPGRRGDEITGQLEQDVQGSRIRLCGKVIDRSIE